MSWACRWVGVFVNETAGQRPLLGAARVVSGLAATSSEVCLRAGAGCRVLSPSSEVLWCLFGTLMCCVHTVLREQVVQLDSRRGCSCSPLVQMHTQLVALLTPSGSAA